MFSDRLRSIFADIVVFIRLKHQQSVAATDSEREDIAVEIDSLRSSSVVVGLIGAITEIHAKQPILLPLVVAVLALKLAYL